MHGDQRRRAVERHRYRRPHETQRIRDAAHRGAAGGAEIVEVLAGRRQHQVAVLAGGNTSVNAGAASPELVRIDPGILERPPTRLQEQPLLRIHYPRTDRRHAEETRIEVIDFLDETTALPGAVPGRGISRNPGPASLVLPSAGYRVVTGFEPPPERGDIRRTRKSACHADDCDSFVPASGRRLHARLGHCLEGRFGCRFRRRGRFAQRVHKVACEIGDGREVEHQGVRRHIGTGEGPVEAVPQLDRHQGIHPQVEEPDRSRRRRGQPQHGLDLTLHEGRQQVLAPRRRGRGEPLKQIFRRGRIALVRVDREQFLQQRRTAVEGLAEHRPVHDRQRRARCVLVQQALQRLETLLRREPARAGRLPPLGDPRALFLRLAQPRPGAPGDGLTRETQRTPVGGELIEEGVGRGMVGLARIAQNAGDAGEQHEQAEIAIRRRPVKVPGPEHLRPQHGLEALPVLVAEGGVRQHADAVDNARKRRQRPVHPLQHPVERSRVRHVGDLDLDAESASAQSLNGSLRRRVGRPAAVQHDRSRAALGKPFGQRAADAAHAAGHEIRSVPPQPSLSEGRRRQHDLADVTRRAHETHRGARLGERP